MGSAVPAGAIVEEFDDVLDLHRQAAFFDTVIELEQAAGIGGEENVRTGFLDAIDFLLEDVHGHVVMSDVVDTGAAAAPIRFGQTDEFDTGHTANQVEGLFAHALRVAEVAGFVVSHFDLAIER